MEMGSLKGLQLTVLLVVSIKLARCMPFPLLSEDPIIDTTFIDVGGNLTTIIHETKDLSEFFKLLTEMRNKKSLSIVGKDNKYIYLLVSDRQMTDGTEEVDFLSEGNEGPKVRKRRGIFGALNNAIHFMGPTMIRNLAVPISLFNYLGYLPVRLPGVPYHIDSGSPDLNQYDPINRFFQ